MNKATGRLLTSLPMSLLILAACPRLANATPVSFDQEPEPGYLSHRSPTRTVTSAATPQRPSGSGFRFDLQAGLGYGGYLGPLFLDRSHGPLVSGAAVFSWGHGIKLGVRIGGFFSEQSGNFHPVLSEQEAASPRLFGGHIAVQATFGNGLWVAKGFGLMHYDPRTSNTGDGGMQQYAYTLPEFVVTAGYNLHLGRHFALQFSLEAATGFTTLRGAANAGLVVAF